MSFYASQLPKTVTSVNGKHDAVSIEPGNSTIVVDNSECGKIKLSMGPTPPINNLENTYQPLILANENGVTIMDISPNNYGYVTLQWGYVGLG
jgi:hypothetical protein